MQTNRIYVPRVQLLRSQSTTCIALRQIRGSRKSFTRSEEPLLSSYYSSSSS